jgi:hypothetical protein
MVRAETNNAMVRAETNNAMVRAETNNAMVREGMDSAGNPLSQTSGCSKRWSSLGDNSWSCREAASNKDRQRPDKD